MTQIPASQAVTEPDKILGEVAGDEDVIVISVDGSTFKIVALPRTPKPVYGSARRLVQIGYDFDVPIEGCGNTMRIPLRVGAAMSLLLDGISRLKPSWDLLL